MENLKVELEDYLTLNIERVIEYAASAIVNMRKGGDEIYVLYIETICNDLREIRGLSEYISMKRNGKVVNLKKEIEKELVAEKEEKRGEK